MSVIARCRSGDIRLFIILKRHDDRLTKKLYWRGESSEGKCAHILIFFLKFIFKVLYSEPSEMPNRVPLNKARDVKELFCSRNTMCTRRFG